MNVAIFKALVGMAWAGAAISSAAPVDAKVITSQTGSYAACSATYQSNSTLYPCDLMAGEPQPFFASYEQSIRFVATACSAGGCTPDSASLNTDMVYPVGRKAVSLDRRCANSAMGMRLYNLGSCAC
jgi:hypothetical protein